ncbi:threonine/serine exporter family protein [Verrucomicrobiaceae bacterium 227]
MSLPPEEFRKRTRFVIKLGRALQECGANSERIERHLTNVCSMLEVQASFLISPTTFTCAFWEEDEMDQFIHIERAEAGEINLGRLWEIDRLVESIDQGNVDFGEALERLQGLLKSPPHHSITLHALSWVLTGASFAILLSPNLLNGLASAIISLLLFVMTRLCSSESWKPVTQITVAFAAGATAAALDGWGINPPFVILSSIIVFIPGLSLTVALTEISVGHLISGSSRLVDATMTLLKLFFGTLSGIAVISLIPLAGPAEPLIFPELPAWRVWPALLGLSIALGIAFNIPKQKMLWGTTAALIAFSSAKLGESQFGMHAGMFLGALSVGLFSNLFARITKGPGSILMTQGIILLVPGSKIYSILNHWVSGEAILPPDTAAKALIAFMALIAGLLFSNALLPARKSL